MEMTRYDPFRELLQLRHQLFHQHFEQPYGRGEETQGTGGAWSPLVDVFEDSEGITLKVELPEVDANDVDIQLEGNALTLRGERKLEKADKQEGYHRIERYYGSFSRSFTLPSTVEAGNVRAQSRDGVLRIFLPRRPKRSRARLWCRPTKPSESRSNSSRLVEASATRTGGRTRPLFSERSSVVSGDHSSDLVRRAYLDLPTVA
jgi:HSP20 family protein